MMGNLSMFAKKLAARRHTQLAKLWRSTKSLPMKLILNLLHAKCAESSWAPLSSWELTCLFTPTQNRLRVVYAQTPSRNSEMLWSTWSWSILAHHLKYLERLNLKDRKKATLETQLISIQQSRLKLTTMKPVAQTPLKLLNEKCSVIVFAQICCLLKNNRLTKAFSLLESYLQPGSHPSLAYLQLEWMWNIQEWAQKTIFSEVVGHWWEDEDSTL